MRWRFLWFACALTALSGTAKAQLSVVPPPPPIPGPDCPTGQTVSGWPAYGQPFTTHCLIPSGSGAVNTSTIGQIAGYTGTTTVTGLTPGGDLTFASPNFTVAKIQGTVVSGVTGTGNAVLSASPTLTGSPLAPTPTTGDSSTKIATTAFVAGGFAPVQANFTLGSTVVTLGQTTSTVSGLTLSGATLSGTISGNPTFSGSLNFSGSLGGIGITNLFTSPPAIGATTPSTGSFTTLTGQSLSVSGAVTFSGITTGTQTSCVGVNGSGALVLNSSPCGSGSGGTPGGTSGQIQYNNAGAFGGFTASGDATITTSTGAVAVSKIGGQAVSLAGTLTTSGAFGLTLTTTATTNATLPAGTSTLLSNALTNGQIFVGSAGGIATGVALSQDVSLTNTGVVTVKGIRTIPVTTNAPADTNTLCYVAVNTDVEWCATTGGSGTVGSGSQYAIPYYASAGTALSAMAPAANAILVTSGLNVPSLSSTLPAAVQGNITSVGTVTGGTWNATVIMGQYGGTGVANTGKTVTLGGNLTTSGASALTLTTTATTNATLPSGTTTLLSNALTSAQIFVGNGSGVATGVAVSGDVALTNAGVTTVNKVNSTTYPTVGALNTVPVVTSTTSGGAVTYEAVPNAALANSTLTLGSTSLALGTTTTSVAALTLTASPNLGIRDTSAAFDVTLGATSSPILTAGQTITLNVKNGSRNFTLGSNLTIATDPGGVTGALKSNGSGTFAQAACSDLSNGQTGCSNAVGTSGAALPLLNASNTWSGVQSFNSGDVGLKGATSGTLTVNAAAIAGTNTLTLPAGTTDFSSTGGTSQVVKQTSAGGAFTVAQLACADLSNAGAGCSSAAGITQLTGDVTAGPGSGSQAATIAANAVTYAKFQQVAASSLVGNPTATNPANAQAISIGATLSFVGSGPSTLETAAGTGDVTWSINSFATTISAAAVTAAKMASGAAASNVGTLGGDLNGSTLPNPTISANAITSGKIATAAVTYAKIQNENISTLLGNPTLTSQAPSEITLGIGCSFSGSVLNCPGTGGTALNRITGTVTTNTLSAPSVAFTTELWLSTGTASKTDNIPACGSSGTPNAYVIEQDGQGTAGQYPIVVTPASGTIGPLGTATFSVTANYGVAVFQCDATSTSWRLTGYSSPSRAVRENTSASFTVALNDNGNAILQQSTTTAVTATIPDIGTGAGQLPSGAFSTIIYNNDTSAGAITLSRTTTTTINGGTSISIPINSGVLIFAENLANNYVAVPMGSGPGTGTVTSVAIGRGISSTLASGGTTAITASGTLYLDPAQLQLNIGGGTLSWTNNTTFGVSAGSASDATNTYQMSWVAFTKTLSAWASGTGNGCLDTGSVAANTWYAVLAAINPSAGNGTVDFICTVAVAPISPSYGSTGLTASRLVGFVRTCDAVVCGGSSTNIANFIQRGTAAGAVYYWVTEPTTELNGISVSTSAALQTLAHIPPGARVQPICDVSRDGTVSVRLYSPDETTPVTDTTTPKVPSTCPFMISNLTQQIGAVASGSSTITLHLMGYIL